MIKCSEFRQVAIWIEDSGYPILYLVFNYEAQETTIEENGSNILVVRLSWFQAT